MLGRLARWLRVIGADTLQLPLDAPDAQLVRRANDDGRILLTRDRHLLRELHPERALAIHHDAPLEQLTEVVSGCDLQCPSDFLTRCLLCNTPLDAVDEDEARLSLPAGAAELRPVRRCSTCGRMYWRGSHARRMEAALRTVLPDWFTREPSPGASDREY
jgi:uncharacterized protein with PIN domain